MRELNRYEAHSMCEDYRLTLPVQNMSVRLLVPGLNELLLGRSCYVLQCNNKSECGYLLYTLNEYNDMTEVYDVEE